MASSQGWFLGGSGGIAPLLKLLFILGGSAPLKVLAFTVLFKVYYFASKVFCIAMINYSLLYGNWDISDCLLYFISTKLKYHICIFENMGVVAPTAPLSKFLETTTASSNAITRAACLK